MKQETLNLIANIDENTVILPKSEGGAFEMYQMDTIADLRKTSRNFMRTEKILENIDAKTSTASETVAGIVTEARIKELSKALDPIQATETVAGIAEIATQTEVNNGLEDTKIVTSKKLKARLDNMLAGITSTYVKLTQLSTESLAGIIKISTTAQVSAGTDNTTAVSPHKLKELYTVGSSKTQNGYQKLPNGVILQWGTIDYNSNPGEIAVDVVFPSVFPTSCLNVTATRKTLANGASDGGVNIVSYSSGSARFQLNTWSSGISGVRGFTWFAIGY